MRLRPRGLACASLWAPPEGTRGAFTTVVLLHGNQGTPADPTWMTGLRGQPAFHRRILLAPALPRGDYAWERPAAVRAVADLVADVASRYPVDPSALFLVGYSAAGSRVLAVAPLLSPRPAGVASLAGDAARTLRGGGRLLPSLRTLPILLACMTGDSGPNASCALDDANDALLRRLGATTLSRAAMGSDHTLRWGVVAPVLDDWLTRVQRGPAGP